MSASDWAREKAREIVRCDPGRRAVVLGRNAEGGAVTYGCDESFADGAEMVLGFIASALDAARSEGREEAAKVADQQSEAIVATHDRVATAYAVMPVILQVLIGDDREYTGRCAAAQETARAIAAAIRGLK